MSPQPPADIGRKQKALAVAVKHAIMDGVSLRDRYRTKQTMYKFCLWLIVCILVLYEGQSAKEHGVGKRKIWREDD